MAESRTPSFDAMNAAPADEPQGGGADPGATAPPAAEGGGDGGSGAGQPRAADGRFAPKNADGSDKTPAQIEAEGKGGNQRVETVPYSALLKERAELKRLKDELRERDERFGRLEGRLSLLQEAWQPQGQPKPQEATDDLGPDPEQDPVGAAKWLREQRAADIKRQREWQAQQAEQAKTQEAQRKEWEDFTNDLAASNRDWEETVTQIPEMNQVLDGLRESFRRELVALGWHGPQLVQKINELEAQHAVYARRSGKHIGEYVAQLAVARGVLRPDGGQVQQPAPAPNGNGQGQAPAAVDPAAANIKHLAAAQAASQTLSGSGGSPGGGKIDLNALDRMSDDELRAFIKSKNANDPGGYEKWKRAQMVGA